jgi:starch synthase
MIAMRYGTVPVVRRTGGLADTVFDVDDDVEKAKSVGLETNGFSFDGADAGGLDYALNRALSFWFSDKDAWIDLSKRIMSMDWSWADPAQDYIQLYHKAISKRIQ